MDECKVDGKTYVLIESAEPLGCTGCAGNVLEGAPPGLCVALGDCMGTLGNWREKTPCSMCGGEEIHQERCPVTR